MRFVGLLVKLAGLMVACSGLSACIFFIGETPPQWVAFEIDFPGKTKDEVFQIAASIAQERNYKPSGEWLVRGQNILQYRQGCARSSECLREFESKAEWREQPPDRRDKEIGRWLELSDRKGSVTVSAVDTKGGARMRIHIGPHGFAAPLALEERAEIIALKPILEERFGPAAVRTEYSRGACGVFSQESNCQFPFWPQSPAGQTQSQTY